ncbi:MAG: hypothetical protein U1C46_05290 [Bacteroidales bacterium]|nr:hypothetical protein [Bacteroidales bacterium]
MKAILFILLSVFLNTEIFAQENKLSSETSALISSVLFIHELNPTEQQDSETINELFNMSLRHYLEKKKFNVQIIDKAFQVLYKNGSSDYSDSPEERRMKSRRALCFASIALLSETENRPTFIEYSQFAMTGNIEKPNIDLLEERFLGLLLLEMLLKHDNKVLTKQDVQKVQEFVNLQFDNLSPVVKDKTKSLIESYASVAK